MDETSNSLNIFLRLSPVEAKLIVKGIECLLRENTVQVDIGAIDAANMRDLVSKLAECLKEK